MKEFLIGLLVLATIGVISFLGVFLFPLLLVLGFFLRVLIGVALCLFAIWVVGKVTLVIIESLRKPKDSL